jgi:hypothetical protein
MKSTIPRTICALLALAVSACSGSSGPSMPTLPTAGTLTAGATSSAAQVQGGPIAGGAPSQIIVFPFATSTADVSLNQGVGARLYRDWKGEDQDTQQAQLAQSTAQNICVEVATSLANKGWNAACQPRGTPLTGNNTLIVDGAFTDISEGNRLQRTVIGLGVGASGIDTQVGLYQYSNGNSCDQRQDARNGPHRTRGSRGRRGGGRISRRQRGNRWHKDYHVGHVLPGRSERQADRRSDQQLLLAAGMESRRADFLG